jgi:electron transfer flavoprotein beta subunit
MKIAVLVKQTPDSETRIGLAGPAPGIDDTKFTRVLSPYDAFAVEEAIRIRERTPGTEVTAITVGPLDRVRETIKKDCLAVGCDKAIVVSDPALADADEAGVAAVLAAVLRRDAYDLILCGKQAIDDDAAQVGVRVAEILGLAHVSVVTKLELADGALTARREIEGGLEIVAAKLPALITCQKGLNEPRLPSLPNIMKAGAKPLQVITCADLGLAPPARTYEIRQYAPPPSRAACRLVQNDDPAAAAAELARLLREEAKVI